MVNLWLHVPSITGGEVAPPRACPRAGCDGRRFGLHQAVGKAIEAPVGRALRTAARNSATPPPKRVVAARRYRCLACGRTFRVYPAGVGRGKTPAGIRRFAVALCVLGLGVRAISELLGFLGIDLGKSHVHALVRGAARRPDARGARSERCLLGGNAIAHDIGVAHLRGADGWVTLFGHRHVVRATVHRDGRAALVIEGIDRRAITAVERRWQAELAALGVTIEVVYPEWRREGMPRRHGRPGGCGRHLAKRCYGWSGKRRAGNEECPRADGGPDTADDAGAVDDEPMADPADAAPSAPTGPMWDEAPAPNTAAHARCCLTAPSGGPHPPSPSPKTAWGWGEARGRAAIPRSIRRWRLPTAPRTPTSTPHSSLAPNPPRHMAPGVPGASPPRRHPCHPCNPNNP